MKKYTSPSVLTIAGFDGSGGAGIQGGYQNFFGFRLFCYICINSSSDTKYTRCTKIYSIPEEAVADRIEAILDDIFPSAIKIGMVHTQQLVDVIVNTLNKYHKVPVVFDPVMVATSGHRLIEEETIIATVQKLFPIADVITPNMDEASILANMQVKTLDDMYSAGEKY